VPPVVFDGQQMSPAEADSLASAISAKTPVFLLLAAPESQAYSDLLKSELDQLQQRFTIQPQLRNEAVALYRLKARDPDLTP
jgi:hypothetical protein